VCYFLQTIFVVINFLASARILGFSELCAGITPVRYALQTR